MDFSPIINQVVGVLWYLIPLVIFAYILKSPWFKSPWFKGVAGEFIVNFSAKLMLDKEKYHLIKNVTLPTEDGSTQIDHIIVSIYGIFVVETKKKIFSGSHALAWEPILDAPASCVSKHRRWRVVTAFPRQRVGTRN